MNFGKSLLGGATSLELRICQESWSTAPDAVYELSVSVQYRKRIGSAAPFR